MEIHIVGGFLGAGKTTAVIGAAKRLKALGKRVGVVTNDQGRYLVDTAFARAEDLPSVEVTGGCFCCRYDDFEAVLKRFTAESRPDVIFAESVGSCADVVVTVVEPLREAIGSIIAGTGSRADFSVFADSRLLLKRLEGAALPFSEDVSYVFDRQLEEAGLLIVNKIDLLDEGDRTRIAGLVGERYPEARAFFLSGKEESGCDQWLRVLAESSGLSGGIALKNIDYGKYAAGELRLAWLDGALRVNVPDSAAGAIRNVFKAIVGAARKTGAGIGHIKVMAEDARERATREGWKASATALSDDDADILPDLRGPVRLTINARMEMDAADLDFLVSDAVAKILDEAGAAWKWERKDAFHPGEPRPQRGRKLAADPSL